MSVKNRMKRLFLIFAVLLTGFSLFANEFSASDLRKVIFGNRWENIIEITDDEIFAACKNTPYMKYYSYRFTDYHLYEEKYGDETLYRFVASSKPLTYENAVKGYKDGTGELWQAVFIKKNGTLYQLASECIFNLAIGDGTVRCWTEDQLGGIEVISRNNKILGLLVHKYLSRITTHNCAEEGSPSFDEYTKKSSASFYFWSDLQNESYFELKDDGIFYLICDRGVPIIPEVTIDCSYPLIESKHPFKYTLQNVFDGAPSTSFVEDEENNLIFIDMYMPKSVSRCKKIKLINGYAQNKMLYLNNNRIKNITDRKSRADAALKDSVLENQIFDWNEYSLHAVKIWSGKKYNDTCIAELDFMSESEEWLFGE